jgi:hypothetical protein
MSWAAAQSRVTCAASPYTSAEYWSYKLPQRGLVTGDEPVAHLLVPAHTATASQFF